MISRNPRIWATSVQSSWWCISGNPRDLSDICPNKLMMYVSQGFPLRHHQLEWTDIDQIQGFPLILENPPKLTVQAPEQLWKKNPWICNNYDPWWVSVLHIGCTKNVAVSSNPKNASYAKWDTPTNFMSFRVERRDFIENFIIEIRWCFGFIPST
jgi:hypothetical protein